ncbi:MAG: FlgD immunoglobulin-like domain containing protein [Candidatus Cloacimonadota bacterium]
MPSSPSTNPFAASCRLEFSLPTRGAAELVVYNLRGQVVRRLHTGYLQEGEHSLAWDGHDESGASCAQGIYLLKLSQQGKDLATRRITLLRR